MDIGDIKYLQEPVKITKLSEAIRVCGYGNPLNYEDCVLGRAYKHVFGYDAWQGRFDGPEPFSHGIAHAAEGFGIPFATVSQTEKMCLNSKTPIEIAEWLEAQGY